MLDDDLCRDCDLFIGYGASGVYQQPDWPTEALRARCWSCGRTPAEIAADAPRFVYGSGAPGDAYEHDVAFDPHADA
jgi:hypothetical protein